MLIWNCHLTPEIIDNKKSKHWADSDVYKYPTKLKFEYYFCNFLFGSAEIVEWDIDKIRSIGHG